ncbi:MAG TPA: lipase maturation factor family protein, partial [Pirellulales bacterium]|nr:lipase maturation factor family protein [Pirellulales bacterium]
MPNPLERPNSQRPVMVFDGQCGFCRASVNRWREAIGQQVNFAPYQEIGAQFPQISEKQFGRAVHFVEVDGRASRGAEAVLRAMAFCGRKRWLLWMYTRLPPFAFLAELAYRFVAANRQPLSMVRRIWWGKDLKQPTYHIASALFLRLLGAIYLIAFVSLWVQIDGLIGDHGILPLADHLDRLKQIFAQQTPPLSPVWNFPTLAWLNPHDGFLHVLCAGGTVLSLMLIAGLLPLPVLVLLWLDYLSLFHAGQVFLGFQWDILLLETGFAAIFLAPFVVRSKFLADRHPPRLAIWLLWWLLFRLMLESGAVKLTWNAGVLGPDGLPLPNTWHSLTALNFHYWTQPLPMWTSWYAAKLPEWFQKLSVVFVLVVELGTPWLFFGPRLLRFIALSAITLLMLLIAATGNYNFFNLLTIALALTLLDDKLWPQFLQRRIRGTDWPVLASPTRWRSVVLFPFAALALLIGLGQVKEAVAPNAEAGLSLAEELDITQFYFVNSYGLFRQMTETRPEILIEGSADGATWKPYPFRWKPGDLSQPPRCNTPHQPRLDWQMWFAALGAPEDSRWFKLFLVRLLQGDRGVAALL